MRQSAEPINWYGTYILSLKEIKRFLRVYHQTVIAPAISALIFLAVFVLALGGKVHNIGGVKFINFMGYGLIIMTIVQNAFSNSSSSIIMSKVIGYIADILVPPFGGIELVIAFTIGSIFRGIIVGLFVTLFISPFVEFTVYHPGLLIFFTLFSCIMLGLLGLLTGLISRSFDENAAITSYIITPLSFLSGTFYSIENLPSFLKSINHFNPFFYMIDGFRYCLTNYADSNITLGIIILITVNVILFTTITWLLNIGWRIKE